MQRPSDRQSGFLREKLIGLGENSLRKNYYPELQKRLEELETFRNVLDKVNDGILLLRLPGRMIVDSNESACSILGISRNRLFETDLVNLFPEMRNLFQGMEKLQSNSGRRQEYSLEYPRFDSSVVPIEVSFEIVALGDNEFAVVIIRDVSENKKTDALLHYTSTHDSLTGLNNRAYLEYEFFRRRETLQLPCTLIACDIDGLQMINETLGHESGDRRLIMTGVLLSALLETGDILARVGGDEFVLFRPGADHKQAEQMCRQLRESVDGYNGNNKGVFLSLSVGYAVAESKPVELYALLRDADNQVRREKLLRSQSARSGIVNTIMTLLEARDFITEGHAERLEILAGGLAEKIGFSSSQQDAVKLFAKFHDIGKVGVSDAILFKPGALNEAEREEMKRHSEIGYRIALSSLDLLHIAEWILRHHEWWDGSGYPLRLAGTDIPLECRILAIVDAFDAMTSDRPYRKAMPVNKAIRDLQKFAGTQFDPELVELFCKFVMEQEMLS